MDTTPHLPHLDQFLNGYMHQDWRLYGDTVDDVIDAYRRDSLPDDLKYLHDEIETLLQRQGDAIERDYYVLYPNSVLPHAFGSTVMEWLQRIAAQAAALSTH